MERNTKSLETKNLKDPNANSKTGTKESKTTKETNLELNSLSSWILGTWNVRNIQAKENELEEERNK